MELKNNASSRPSLIYSWLVVFYSDSNGQAAKSQTAASAKSCLGPHSQPSCKLGRVGLFLTIFKNKPKTYDLKFFFNPKTFSHPKFFSQKKYIGLKTFLWPNKSFKNSLTTNILFNQRWTELDTAQSQLTFPYLVMSPDLFLYQSPITKSIFVCPVLMVTGFNNDYLTMIRY